MLLKEFATNVKRKTCSKVVNIVPVFWKSSDELSQRLSVPVCQKDPGKGKRWQRKSKTESAMKLLFIWVQSTRMVLKRIFHRQRDLKDDWSWN